MKCAANFIDTYLVNISNRRLKQNKDPENAKAVMMIIQKRRKRTSVSELAPVN